MRHMVARDTDTPDGTWYTRYLKLGKVQRSLMVA
jgi:hypothetical protein